RKRAAVGWNNMVSIVLLPQHHQAILMMNVAVGKRRLVRANITPRHAVGSVIPFVLSLILCLAGRRESQLTRPDVGASGRLTRTSSLDVLSDVSNTRMIPGAGEIGLPVRQPRHGLAGSVLGGHGNRSNRGQRETQDERKNNRDHDGGCEMSLH